MDQNHDKINFNLELPEIKLIDSIQKIVIINAFATVISGIAAGYFQINYFASLFFVQNDGWCKVPSQSIGVHCFGDFNERFLQSKSDFTFPAFHNNLELSPIGPFITFLSNHLLINIFTPKEVILFWLFCAICFIALPILLLSRKSNNRFEIAFLTFFTLTSFPLLASIDRLNDIYLSVPLFFVFFNSIIIKKNNLNKNWIFIPLLCIIKPQYLLLSFFFLLRGEFKSFFKSFISATVAVIFLVTVIDHFRLSRFAEWVKYVLHYSDRSSINSFYGQAWPANYSIYSSIKNLILSFISLISNASQFEFSYTISYISMSLASFLIFNVIYIIIKRRKLIPSELILLYIMIVITFTPQVYVAGYYTVPLVIFVTTLCFTNTSSQSWLSDEVTRRAFLISVLLTVTTTIIPIFYINNFMFHWIGLSTELIWFNLLSFFVPVSWYIFIILSSRLYTINRMAN